MLTAETLEKKYILGGPVTAVSVVSHGKWLVAKGPYLEVHYAFQSQPIERHLIFCNGVSIHGIQPAQDDMIVVYGGNHIAFIHSETMQALPINEKATLFLSDWIWHVQARENMIAVCLANNVCELWKIEGIALDGQLRGSRRSRWANEARCLTYCMTSVSPIPGTITIASGTIFNEILVWTVDEHIERERVTTKPTEHKLIGHEGVILGLAFEEKGSMLASTSDDRSIRLWTWVSSDGAWSCQWIRWGHTARIWSVVFVSDGQQLVTTGEDGTARLWSTGDSEQELAQVRNYSSQSLWCATSCQEFVLLGTNDGSAKIWDLSTVAMDTDTLVLSVPDDRPVHVSRPLVVEENQPSINKKKKKKTKVPLQIIVGIDFYTLEDTHSIILVAATRVGSLFYFAEDAMEWMSKSDSWQKGISTELLNPATAQCFAISDSRLAVVGTANGYLVAKQLGKFNESTLVDARDLRSVQGLKWVTPALLASFHLQGVLALWRPEGSSLLQLHMFDTTTNAIPTCIALFDDGMNLVVGDSRGNLSSFRCDGQAESGTKQTAKDVARRMHKYDCVNQVVCCGGFKIMSVGNDGCVSESFVDADGKLSKGTSVPVSGLSGVTDLWVDESATRKQILVSGYFGNTYLIVDFTNGFELSRFETQGRQRQLSHFMDVKTRRYIVAVCANQKDGTNKLLFKSNRLQTLSSLGTVLHGEPVYDVCLFATRPDATYATLLSGSEDCTAQLTFLDCHNVIFSMRLPPQKSCVRAVAASRCKSSNSTLLTVCGGKLSVDFYLIIDKSNGSTFTEELIQVMHIGTGIAKEKSSIDHRINAVQAEALGDASHFVVTGDSNGAIVIFLVQAVHGMQIVRIPGTLLSVLDRPVIAIDTVRLGDSLFVFVGTTGGEISVWAIRTHIDSNETELPSSPVYTYQAHQMGANCVCCTVIAHLDEQRLKVLVCSGGDDQSVTLVDAILSEDLSSGSNMTVLSSKTVTGADVSALKGVYCIGNGIPVTVGYAQSLKLWGWSSEGATQVNESIPVDVADVNCLAGCTIGNQTYIAVGGEGIELICRNNEP